MSTITLPNIRVSSDLTVSVRLKDNGVAIDWSTLNNVKASIYSDAQRALAGRCDVSVNAEDPTVLVCQYAANKPQYVGVCRIVVSAKYMGETKTYDKPAFNFVRWTADQDGEQITIDDPDVDVEIDVADVSSSLLDEAIRAAFTAAEEAVDAKDQVLETEAEVEAAEALRVSAEESRVEAEEGRAEAEAARVDEEAVRVSAEDARVVAENARAAAEDLREGAEDDRAAAETARETAEAARVAAEALRVTAEGSRETAEAAREAQASADHTVAAGDHTQAAADHTQAAADHTTAASDHTQAGADHTLAAADHVTAGEDHAQAQDDHEVMEGYDTRLGSVESEVSQLEAELSGVSVANLTTFATGKKVIYTGSVADDGYFNIYSVDLEKGDYISVIGNNAASIGVIARTSDIANRYDVLKVGGGYMQEVKCVCDKASTYYITTNVGVTYTIRVIKNKQYQELLSVPPASWVDATPITTKTQGYIKYSDGSFNTSGSLIYVHSLRIANGVKKVRAFVTGADTVAAAIAFYSATTISSANFISGVQMTGNQGGGCWFEADVPAGAVLVAITNHSSYNANPLLCVDSIVGYLTEDIETEDIRKNDALAGNNPFRFNGPFYAHLFIDKIYQNSTDIKIPSESLEDIRVAKRLGFNIIEANVQPTSDGKFVVIHGVSGKFGYEVTDLDGAFTYADTAINSVTLDWIKANIRYRSDIARYRTTIPSLEEFLTECRIQNMIPFCTVGSSAVKSIVEGIMGYNNYIAYEGSRALTSAPIYKWQSLTTKAQILELARSIGVPFIYGMQNSTSFTDEDLADIVKSLHTEGFMIGSAYVSGESANRLRRLGFDILASTFQVNDFGDANLCTLSAVGNWNDFSFRGGASGTDAGVSLVGVSQQIRPATELPAVSLAKAQLQVTFSGTLWIVCGKDGAVMTSDGKHPAVFSSYFINASPTFIIYGQDAGATVTDVVFKVSKC